MRDQRARLTCSVAVTLAVAAAVALVPTRAGGAGGAADFALARFLQPASRPLVTYRALRHLSGHTDDGGMRATMTVWTELVGNGQFRYQIVSEEGSEKTRSKVFRGVLEAEANAVRSGECDRGDLTLSNYQFAPDGSADDGLARVAMTPRRPHPMRIVGDLFLRPEDGSLVRVEGQLSKRPSFWTRRIDVVHRYAAIAGTSVPTTVEASAQVLFLGRYDFAMTWEYESVNGQRVGDPMPHLAQVKPARGNHGA
jgi:hypothetical protein